MAHTKLQTESAVISCILIVVFIMRIMGYQQKLMIHAEIIHLMNDTGSAPKKEFTKLFSHQR